MTKILGIVGSYRKNGIIDALVTEALSAAEAAGATTKKIYLVDAQIEFCRNCRYCTQQPGPERGACVQSDDVDAILTEWAECDGLVLGAPVNFFNITAVTRQFMERLVCFTYWPWGQMAPTVRTKGAKRKAVLITSSAMPGFLIGLATGAPRALQMIAKTMGAKVVGTIRVGLVAGVERPTPPNRAVRQAQAAGRRLVTR